jgi:hypothetical protein
MYITEGCASNPELSGLIAKAAGVSPGGLHITKPIFLLAVWRQVSGGDALRKLLGKGG